MKTKQFRNPVFLKTGFTTGACACAASVAALESLLSNENVELVQVELPNGESYSFDCAINRNDESSVTASVIKDAGDDVDITDGIEILSSVKVSKTPGIKIEAGRGIGVCTKEGLAVKVGEPAINPVPRKNIKENLRRVLNNYGQNDLGIKVELSIPRGEELATKTFNEKLGIVNGLSILGTTGIVKPMSNEAIVKTIYYELKQVLSRSKERAVVLVPGNYGKAFALKMGINKDLIVQVSNFVGDTLDIVKELGFNKILLVGDLGKLIKVAGGIFQTHSRVADGRMEIFAANLAAIGAPTSLINQVLNSTTTSQVTNLIMGTKFEKVYQILTNKIKDRIEKRNGLIVDVVLFSNETGLLSKTISDDNQDFFK